MKSILDEGQKSDQQQTNDNMSRTEQLLKSLECFKDWSNYLLVTTVAALGWVAGGKDGAQICLCARHAVILCLGLSVICAIFTLALIPHVAEKITDTTDSFYRIKPKVSPFWFECLSFPVRLKWVCWPQHVLFILGIAIFTFASILTVPESKNPSDAKAKATESLPVK